MLVLGERCSCCSRGSARVARATSLRGRAAAAGRPATLSGMPTHPGPGEGPPDVGLIPQHQDGWRLDGEFSATLDDGLDPGLAAGPPGGRGVVMPLGGAEDKLGRMTILR